MAWSRKEDYFPLETGGFLHFHVMSRSVTILASQNLELRPVHVASGPRSGFAEGKVPHIPALSQ